MNRILMEAIQELLFSESNEGCSEDLTVVSSAAIEKLRKEYEKEKGKPNGKGKTNIHSGALGK